MSNYITEAFKALNLLEDVEDIQLNAAGQEELKSFLDMAGADPDEEMIDVYDLEAEAEDELKQSYVGKVVLECKVCHSHIFEDKLNVSVDEEGDVCKDLECPYCMSNEGYILIGEIAPFNEEESEKLMSDEEELPEVDVETSVDEVEEDDLEESLHEGLGNLAGSVLGNIAGSAIAGPIGGAVGSALGGAIGNSFDEELKLDGVEELYDNDELRGVEELEGDEKLEGSDDIRGDKHKAPINESIGNEDVIQALNRAAEDNSNFLISNKPGRGTLNTIVSWCKDNGYRYKVVDCLSLDPDLSAEPSDFGGVIDRTGKRHRYELVSELKQLDDHSVIVFDNLNRVPEASQKMLLFIIEKTPCIVVGVLTGNDSLDPTIKSKFSSKIDISESKKLKEDIEDVSVTTSDETMTMTTKEDGGVVIETEPKKEEEFISDEEMIVPISSESSDEIEASIDANSEEEGEEDTEFSDVETQLSEEEPEEFDEFEDFDDFEDFDEDSFNGLGESYLRNCYSNVDSFKTTGVSSNRGNLIIEGIIKFDSGNIKETQFVFKPTGKGLYEGYNKQISRGKKTYKLNTSVKENKLVCESLNYNYRSRNELNESVRVYGTVKKRG